LDNKSLFLYANVPGIPDQVIEFYRSGILFGPKKTISMGLFRPSNCSYVTKGLITNPI